MNLTIFLLALFEFVLTAVLALLVIYLVYRLFIATNADYDAEEEMRKGNIGVGFLLASMLFAAGLIVREGIYPVVNLLRLYVTTSNAEIGGLQLALLAAGHLALVFVVAVYSISLTLRFWGRLTRNIEEGAELKRGNLAVGIVLGGVVLLMAMFMSEGISRVTKSLIPQPPVGHVEFAP